MESEQESQIIKSLHIPSYEESYGEGLEFTTMLSTSASELLPKVSISFSKPKYEETDRIAKDKAEMRKVAKRNEFANLLVKRINQLSNNLGKSLKGEKYPIIDQTTPCLYD